MRSSAHLHDEGRREVGGEDLVGVGAGLAEALHGGGAARVREGEARAVDDARARDGRRHLGRVEVRLGQRLGRREVGDERALLLVHEHGARARRLARRDLVQRRDAVGGRGRGQRLAEGVVAHGADVGRVARGLAADPLRHADRVLRRAARDVLHAGAEGRDELRVERRVLGRRQDGVAHLEAVALQQRQVLQLDADVQEGVAQAEDGGHSILF
jgi:hypothetical protein